MTCAAFEQNVDAYLDQELSPEAMAGAHVHLAACQACSRMLADRIALGRLVRALPYHAAPERLRTAVTSKNQLYKASRASLMRWAAAIVAVVSLGGAADGVRIALDHRAVDAAAAIMATAIVDGHVRALADGHLYDVQSTDQHTVKPWFLGKIDFSPPVNDLASIGFPLAGGRVGAIQGRPAAVLVYERRLHPIEVFIRPASPGDTPAWSRSIRGFQLQHWVAGDMSFWAVSDLNADELKTLVIALRAMVMRP